MTDNIRGISRNKMHTHTKTSERKPAKKKVEILWVDCNPYKCVCVFSKRPSCHSSAPAIQQAARLPSPSLPIKMKVFSSVIYNSCFIVQYMHILMAFYPMIRLLQFNRAGRLLLPASQLSRTYFVEYDCFSFVSLPYRSKVVQLPPYACACVYVFVQV